MYCKCKEPKTVDVIIQHKKHMVCSKRLGGCGEEYKPKVVTGGKAKLFMNGVELAEMHDVTYSVNYPAYPLTDEDEDDFAHYDNWDDEVI